MHDWAAVCYKRQPRSPDCAGPCSGVPPVVFCVRDAAISSRISWRSCSWVRVIVAPSLEGPATGSAGERALSSMLAMIPAGGLTSSTASEHREASC